MSEKSQGGEVGVEMCGKRGSHLVMGGALLIRLLLGNFITYPWLLSATQAGG